jgi:hypothetical protein
VPRTPPSLARPLERATQHALDTTTRLPAVPAAQTVEQLLAVPRAAAALDEGYAAWQAAVMAARQSRNLTYVVGALDSEVLGALLTSGIEPVTAAIVVRDVEVLHALRDAKAIASTTIARSLTSDELARLPALLRSPSAVLLDVERHDLLYVVDASSRRETGKVVVALNYRLKTDAGKQIVNSFRTASLVDLENLEKDVAVGKLVLLRGTLR